jgi:putative copper export protein
MSILRFLMLLSLVVWLGGITFFAFVLAPTVFAVLPTRELAGAVVNRTLPVLHWMGVVSGIGFLATSMGYATMTTGSPQALAPKHILVVVMLVLTLVSMFVVSSRMMALRAEMGVIDTVPQDDPRRVEFNRLHHWSTRLEGSVYLIGLVVLYLTARQLK